MALSVLAFLVAPAFATAATQVATTNVAGLDVVTVTDDGGDAEIQVSRGFESGMMDPFVAVESTGGATPGVGCETITSELVTCAGHFDEVVVRGNGGADEITLGLIADGEPPLLAEVFGGVGNDTLKTPADSRDIPQPETLLSGELGNDTIEGGNGVDDLRGGEGNDTIRGFGGSDFFIGEEGDDSIDARDGISDLVECGTGFDTAETDTVDAVDATCESVLGQSPIPAPTPAPPPSALASLPAFGPQTLVTLELATQRIPAAGPLRVRVENANGFAVSGEIAGRKKKRSLKAKSFSVSANAESMVKLAVPAALRLLLKRTGKLALKLTAQVKDPSGNTRTVNQRVAVKRRLPSR